MPGATFTQESRVEQRLDERPGGVQSSTSKVRPLAVRRAGSAYATSKGVVSIAVASATVDRAAEPEGVEVGARDLDAQRVEVDAGSRSARPGRTRPGRRRCRSRGRPGSAAAEAPHARGPVGGDRQPGGLLEARRG